MLASGAVLQDRYRIVHQIAEGGMGRVYLAEDQRFRNSQVAVKEAQYEGRDMRQAFEREAELLHHLRHPALPHVTDYFIEGDKQYLVMQFIPGMTLEELLVEKQKRGDGPFTTDLVLQWAGQLLDVLEYLHGHHPPIIHRDIKPQNLKLTPRGEVILLDFGLAKGATTEMSQAGGSIRGYTRRYASLEQIEGKGTDPRSDLYALAATLYRLLTGAYPTDALTRASAVLSGHPDPLLPANALNPRVPAVAASALSRALAQNPDERPGTVGEVRRVLCLSVHSGSSASGDQLLKDMIADPPIQEPEISVPIMLSGAAPSLESTFVGQTTPTDNCSRSVTPRSESASPPAANRTARIARTVRALIWVSILASTVPAYRYWNSGRTESSAGRGLSGNSSLSPAALATSAVPKVMAEVMSCSLELERTGKRVPVNTPLKPGELFKLGFTTRQAGYLYIIAPDVNNVSTMFLTARPNPDWGAKTNRIEAGADYRFPDRADKWLKITGDVGAETYFIIFVPAPFDRPGFLAGPAGRRLTAAEFDAMRQRFLKGAGAELSPGEPFGFEIRVETTRR